MCSIYIFIINIKAINFYFVFFKHNLDEEEDGKTPTQPLLKKGRHFSSFYFNPLFHTVNSLIPTLLFSFFYFSFYFHGEVLLQLFIKWRLEKLSLVQLKNLNHPREGSISKTNYFKSS